MCAISRRNPRRVLDIAATVALVATSVMSLSTDATAAIQSSKRGFGDTGATYGNLQATGAGWYYTWGTGTGSPGIYDAANYPMFWSAPSQSTIDNVKTRNPQYVLGFNEPERSDQANMTVAQAISSWTNISSSFTGTSTKLVSPAVADTSGTTGGQQWLASFMSQANAARLKVDAVAFHWYGVSTPDNPAGAASSFLSRVDSYHNSYGLPVFITEFAIHDWGGVYTDAQIIEANRQFLNIVIPGLESRSYVAGYAWYNWFSDSHLYDGSPPTPTPMAYSYVGAIATGTTEDVGGKDLGEHVAYLTGGELTMTGAIPGTLKYINALAGASSISGSIDWSLSGSSSWVRIQPGATLRKSGSNLITLGARTITNNGVLEIAQGVLRLNVPIDGSGSINISSTGGATGSTARLELTGNVSVGSAITFAQRNDPGGSDGIRNVSGSNTLSGALTIVVGGSQTRVRSDAGLLTLAGAVSTNATSARNLYFQGAGNGVVSGVISDNPSNAAGSINLHKEGPGTWTFAGANTYTGTTSIAGGTLVLGSAAWGPVLTGPGGAELSRGRLVFDYSGGVSPAGTIESMLTAGNASGFTAGEIRATGLTTNTTLGWRDDTAAAKVIVGYVVYGDANLDNIVDLTDFTFLAANFNKQSTAVWADGDYNYDGNVDLTDFTYLAGNFNASLSAGDSAAASAGAVVPEPAAASLLMIANVLGCRSTRRRSGGRR